MLFIFTRFFLFAVLPLVTMVAYTNCTRVGFSIFDAGSTQSNETFALQTVTITAPIQAVDILLVIDNSASMDAELSQLGSKFSNFSQALAGIDWQICLTTTDADLQAGQTIEWTEGVSVLNSSVADYANIFKNKLNSNAGGNGSGFEQPIKSANKTFLLSTSSAANCFRSGVAKSVVIISDEDELSDGWTLRPGEPSSGLTPTALNYPNSLISTVQEQFPLASISVNAIAIVPNDLACLETQRNQGSTFDFRAGYPAVRISELASLAQGNIYSICNSDYAPALEKIASSIAASIKNVELPCSSSGAMIHSINPLSIIHQNRIHHLDGHRLSFEPGLVWSEKIEVSFSCN